MEPKDLGMPVQIYGIPFDDSFLGHGTKPREGGIAKFGYHPNTNPPVLHLLCPTLKPGSFYTMQDKRDWNTLLDKEATDVEKVNMRKDAAIQKSVAERIIKESVVSVFLMGGDATRLGKPNSEKHDYLLTGIKGRDGTFWAFDVKQVNRDPANYPTKAAEAQGTENHSPEQLTSIPGRDCDTGEKSEGRRST